MLHRVYHQVAPAFEAHQFQTHAVRRDDEAPIGTQVTGVRQSANAGIVHSSTAPTTHQVTEVWHMTTVFITNMTFTTQGQVPTDPVMSLRFTPIGQVLTLEFFVGFFNVSVFDTDAT